MKKIQKKSPAMLAAEAGIIAAAYVVLTWLSSLLGLSSGVIQVRISEALCVLPMFTPAAIPGLAIGCALSNLITSCFPMDILFGSIATLIGAVGAYLIGRVAVKRKSVFLDILVSVPNLAANTLIVPWILRLVYGAPGAIWYFMLTVGAGELIAGVVLGSLLIFTIRKKVPKLLR